MARLTLWKGERRQAKTTCRLSLVMANWFYCYNFRQAADFSNIFSISSFYSAHFPGELRAGGKNFTWTRKQVCLNKLWPSGDTESDEVFSWAFMCPAVIQRMTVAFPVWSKAADKCWRTFLPPSLPLKPCLCLIIVEYIVISLSLKRGKIPPVWVGTMSLALSRAQKLVKRILVSLCWVRDIRHVPSAQRPPHTCCCTAAIQAGTVQL